MTFYETQVNNSNSTFYCLTCMRVCLCMFMYVVLHMCAHTRGDQGCGQVFSLITLHLHIDAVFHLTLDPRVLRFDQSSWPACLEDPVSNYWVQDYGQAWWNLYRCRVLNSGPHAGTTRLLTAEPHPRLLRQQSFTGSFYCSCCECVWVCGHMLLFVCHMGGCP